MITFADALHLVRQCTRAPAALASDPPMRAIVINHWNAVAARRYSPFIKVRTRSRTGPTERKRRMA
jgi:hypothetical protein